MRQRGDRMPEAAAGCSAVVAAVVMALAGVSGSLSGSSKAIGSATGAKPVWPCALLGGVSGAEKQDGDSPLIDGSVSLGMRLNSLWLDRSPNSTSDVDDLAVG